MGDRFTVALKKDGTVWTWGKNEDGQLGTGNTQNASVPTEINIANLEAAVGSQETEITTNMTETPVIIVVTAEDGSEDEYELTIRKMTNNTNIAGLYVDDEKIEPDENGKYVIKVGNKSEVVLRVQAEYENAVITIDGLEAGIGTSSTNIELEEEEKIVKVKVIAEDGSYKEYEVTLKKFSSDNTLLSVEATGIEEEFIQRTSDTVYEIEVPNTLEEVELIVTATNEFAHVKVQDSEYSENNKAIQTITLDEAVLEIPVVVRAENGTEQGYTIILKSENDIRAEKILVEDEETVLEEDGKYHAKVDPALETATLKVNTMNENVIVQVSGITDTGVGTSEFEIPMTNSEVSVTVTIQDPDKPERQKEYIVVITKQDADATLESIVVDKVNATLEEDKYKVNVLIKDGEYEVIARANSNSAKVQIEDLEFAEKENKYMLDLSDTKTKEITVRVQAESGRVEEYPVVITKVSDNNKLESILVNETNVEVEETDDYKVLVSADVEQATIVITAEDENAMVKLNNDEANRHQSTITTDLKDGASSVKVVVTAENGDTKTYTINIAKKSVDTGLEFIKVNGNIIKEVDGIYTAKIKDTKADIEIKASNDNSIVDLVGINSQVSLVHVVTSLDSREETYTIKVTAESGDISTHTLVIRQISSDTEILSVKVNEIEADYIEEEKSYVYILPEANTADLEIIARDDFATINANNVVTGTKKAEGTIYLPSEVTQVSIKVTAEGGEQEERTLYVVKQTDITSLETVTVNGTPAVIGEDGNYYANIREVEEKVEVYAKTAKQFAKVDINNTNEPKYNEKTVELEDLTDRIIEVPIKVIATDGTEQIHKLYITRLSANANVSSILVDNENTDLYDEETKTYTKFIAIDVENVTIKAISENEYAKLASNENEAISELEFSVEITDLETTLPLIITAEDNLVVQEYSIKLVRISDDAGISAVTVNGAEAEEQEDKYYIEILDTNDTADVEVTANCKYATVELDEEVNVGVSTKQVIFEEEQKTVTLNIKVTSQNGENVVEKPLEIQRISKNNALESIYAGEEENKELVTEYDPIKSEYTAYVLKTKETEIFTIKAENAYATIECEGTEGPVTGQGTIQVPIDVMGDYKEIEILVTSEYGETRTYKLVILDKSDNANILSLYIGEERLTPDETGLIYAKNIPKLLDSAGIRIIPENEKASIKVSDEEAIIGTVDMILSINLKENEIRIPVIVTAQDEITQKTYEIILTRLSNNTAIETLKLNDKVIEIDENRNYEAIIKVGIDEANLDIKLSDNKSIARIKDETEYVNAEMELIIPTEGSKGIEKVIQVVAEDGTFAEYKLIIKRKQDDLRLEKIYIDGRLVNKVDENTYSIDVLKDKETTNIHAIAVEKEEYVKIAEMNEEPAEAIFENYSLEEGETTVPIKVMADDKVKDKDYNLVITRVNTPEELSDLGLNIVVDGKDILPDDTGTYIAIVGEKAITSKVEVTATSKTTKVQIGENSAPALRRDVQDIVLEEGITKVPITLENGEGTRRTVILNLTKVSDDAEIKEITANGRKAILNEDGSYTAYINQNTDGTELQATANMELARVCIDGNKETRGINIETIDTSKNNITTVKVTVTALSGKTIEYIVHIEKMAKLTGKIITQVAEGRGHIATVTAYRKDELRDENINNNANDNSSNVNNNSINNNNSGDTTNNNNSREVIDSCVTSPDGTYELQLMEGEFELVVTKPAYLTHRITNVTVEANEDIPMEDIELYAGDINGDGQIELSDWTIVTINAGTVNGDPEKALCDVNEDGVVNKLDRNIVKANYNKINSVEEWVVPEEVLNNRNDKGLILPVTTKYVITSECGVDSSIRTGKHTGIDLVPEWHSDIVAVKGGEVVAVGVSEAFGNYVEIKHEIKGKTLYSFYAHLSEVTVKTGDIVKQGQVIGKEGGADTDPNHGNSTGHHLHFEIRTAIGFGNDVNPRLYINF